MTVHPAAEPSAPPGAPGAATPAEGVCLLGIVAAAACDPQTGIGGLEFAGRPLQCLAAGPVAAVLAPVDLERFAAPSPEDREGEARLIALALDHHAAVEALAARTTILPARFGTVLRDRDALGRLLDLRCDALMADLRRLQGLQEFGVRAIALATPMAGQAAETTGQEGAGGRGFLLAKQARRREVAESEERITRAMDAVMAEIHQCAVAVREGTATAADPPGLRLKLSLLARNRTAASLQAALERALPVAVSASDDAAPPVRIAVSGPFPPYSFVEVALHD